MTMDKANINLVPTESRFQLAKLRFNQAVKRLTILSIVVCLVVFGLLGSVHLGVNYRLNSLNKEKQRLDREVKALSPQMDLQQTLRWRLKLVAQVLVDRVSFAQSLDNLKLILPIETEVKRMKLAPGGIEFSGIVPDLASLEELENKINQDSFYSAIELKSLGRETNGWGFSLKLSFKKGA
ncbi:MAG: hypothetical protein ABID04_03930 [Patescibacteria group bacterium]